MTKKPKPPDGPESPEDPKKPKKPKKPRRTYETRLAPRTFEFLVNNVEKLAHYLEIEDSDEVDISGNESLKRKIVEDYVREAFEELGFKLKSAMSPADAIAKVAKKMRGRIQREIKEYLGTDDAEFLDAFEIGRLNDHNHVREAIEWVKSQRTDRDSGFYLRCLEVKYKGRFIDDMVPVTWISAAHNHEFMLMHPLTSNREGENKLPEKAEGEEYAVSIASYFTKNQGDYHPGDATRLIDGLFVAGRLLNKKGQPEKDISTARWVYGNPTNYVIVNYGVIDGIIDRVIERIKRKELRPDRDSKNKPIYKGIREGTLSLSDQNLDQVRIVLNRQLLPDEREAFETLRTFEDEPISDKYRHSILNIYLRVKGNSVFDYSSALKSSE